MYACPRRGMVSLNGRSSEGRQICSRLSSNVIDAHTSGLLLPANSIRPAISVSWVRLAHMLQKSRMQQQSSCSQQSVFPSATHAKINTDDLLFARRWELVSSLSCNMEDWI